MHSNCGTNEVENSAEVVCYQNVRKGRKIKLVNEVMKHKIDDAVYDEKQVRQCF